MTHQSTQILDAFLASSPAAPGAAGIANLVIKDNYSKMVAHGNVSSYSMQSVLHACPRKYQIKKLQAATGTSERIQSVTFSFGHAVGAGVAVYDQVFGETQDTQTALTQAIWAAFLAWDIDLLEVETKGTYADGSGKPTGKSFAMAIWALEKYAIFHAEETNLSEYETVKIEGTLAVDFEDGHWYFGHIDELLIHRETGAYLVKENKTTGLRSVDPVMYANSDQALSYAIAVDMLGGTEYAVLYTVYSSSAQEWFQFSFVKNPLKKASWLQDQLLQHQQVDNYSELNFFPQRGASCFDYMKRCEYFERCDIDPSITYGMKYSDMKLITTVDDIAAVEPVDYFTTMRAIVARQKGKLNDN